MKSIVAIIMVAFSTVALANGPGHGSRHHHHHQYHHGHDWRWVAPAIVSGAVVYALTRPQVAPAPPVVVAPPPDIVYIDGVAYRKQLVLINGYYQEVLVRI